MNKKGDITITMLVIGVIAVCFLTILSFSINRINQENNFAGIGLIETINSISHQENFLSSHSDFKSIYGNDFKSGNVEIKVDKNVINGTYALEKTNWIRSCDGKGFAYFQTCKKELARVTYKR